MSQRFGRNQRRRAREAIASLQHDKASLERINTATSTRLGAASATVAELRYHLNEIREMTVRMSVLFPATDTYRVASKSTDNHPVQVAAEVNPFSFGEPDERACLTVDEFKTLLTSINYADFARCMHVNVHFGDEVIAYGVTEHAWKVMSPAQRQRNLMKEIPKSLAQLAATREVLGNRSFGRNFAYG